MNLCFQCLSRQEERKTFPKHHLTNLCAIYFFASLVILNHPSLCIKTGRAFFALLTHIHKHWNMQIYIPYPINIICCIPQQPQARKTHFAELMCLKKIVLVAESFKIYVVLPINRLIRNYDSLRSVQTCSNGKYFLLSPPGCKN